MTFEGIVFGACIAFVAGVVACAALTSCNVLSPADQQAVTDEAAGLARCQSLGLACKADGGTDCYDVYDRCVQDGGLR